MKNESTEKRHTNAHESEHTGADIEVIEREHHNNNNVKHSKHRKKKDPMPQWCGYGCYRTYVK
jgi:hypothetical protein